MPVSTHSTGSTEEFRSWLSHEMEMRGWSQARLARELDLFKGTVGRWLFDEDHDMHRRPSYESCVRLSELFGRDLDWILHAAGIVEENAQRKASALQRHVMTIVSMIPDQLLVVIEPQLKALIDPNVQALITEQLADVEKHSDGINEDSAKKEGLTEPG